MNFRYFSGDEPDGYSCLCLFIVRLDLIFDSIFCTFLSIFFVGSSLSFWTWVVIRILKHFFVYFPFSKITTSLPLLGLTMTISFCFDHSLTIFLFLYGNFIFAFLSQIFRSFVLICCNFVSGILEMFFSKFW